MDFKQLSPRKFLLWAIVPATLLVLSVVAIPLALATANFGCGPACSKHLAQATRVTFNYVHPYAPYGAAVWLGVIAWRRAVDWGRAGWVSLVIPALILVDAPRLKFLTYSIGKVPLEAYPWSAAAALALVPLLASMPSSQPLGDGRNKLLIRSCEWSSLANLIPALAILAITGIGRALQELPSSIGDFSPLIKAVMPIQTAAMSALLWTAPLAAATFLSSALLTDRKVGASTHPVRYDPSPTDSSRTRDCGIPRPMTIRKSAFHRLDGTR